MPFSIMLFFDDSTEKRLKSVWKELAETDVDSYLHHSDNRPHLKLSIFEALNLVECQARLQSLAISTAALSIDFKYFGIFPNLRPTIFLGAAVTESLLMFKEKVDCALKDLGTCPSYDFFQPGHWTPHCLFAMELAPEKLHKGLEVVMRLPLPLHGEITEIGVIEFFPVKHLFMYKLGS